jgi:Tfp pilus assembly protein FimT
MAPDDWLRRQPMSCRMALDWVVYAGLILYIRGCLMALVLQVRREQEGARSCRRAYSLVELLMVTVVALILLGLTAPLFRSITRSSMVDVGASNLGAELRIARQYAITQNVYTGVLMPTAQNDNQGGTTEREFKARAYRICTLAGKPVYNATTRSWEGQFQAYLSESTWAYMPSGVFIGNTLTHGDYGATDADCRANTISNVTFPEATSPDSLNFIRAVMFRPNGSMIAAPQGGNPGTNDVSLVVFRGILDLPAQRVLPDGDGLQSRSLAIRRFTGKVDFLK